jgi:hypothetical protein
LHFAVCTCPSKMSVVCIINTWFVVIYCHALKITNWYSLETCLQNFLRRANVQADLNTLTLMLNKEH